MTVSDLSRFFKQNKLNESDSRKETSTKLSHFIPIKKQALSKFINPQ
jgi:hypothetical protein